jgi:hypothetical protein
MKVFISWSGQVSRELSKHLYDWLPTILQNLELFMSSEDIDKGSRWLSTMAGELQDCNFGLICLTPENLNAPWIHFEAGSLSKIIDRSKVVPILFRLDPSDVKGPLTQFQMVNFGKDEIYSLLKTINNADEEPKLDENRLKRVLDKFWTELDDSIKNVTLTPFKELHKMPEASQDGVKPILEEILVLARKQSIISSDTFPAIAKLLEDHDGQIRILSRPSDKKEFLGRDEAARLYGGWYRFVMLWQIFIKNFAEAGIPEEQWSPVANAIASLDDELQTALMRSPEKRPVKRYRVSRRTLP